MAKMVIYSGSKLVHVFDLIDLCTGRKVGDSFVAEDRASEGSPEEYAVLQQRWENTWQQLKELHQVGLSGEEVPAAAAPAEMPAVGRPVEKR